MGCDGDETRGKLRRWIETICMRCGPSGTIRSASGPTGEWVPQSHEIIISLEKKAE